jgi:chromosome segregation protein
VHFKRLRLNGFKSFVDPAELLIEQGVTGIVGPNGCGKSNLLEALRWVMGESSAKSMRGNDMDDVIFAGTDRRPPRPYAEVVLTLDNSKRTAPPQFNNDDTLEISRKITRDMGSTYRINGKEVRAKDLQILFADAATGANSPALVRQGQISQLIHAKPKQRRVILEEAAGIGGLYTRRHEAELRLKAASLNLERLEDILKTTEVRLGALRRQAKQAEKYKEISAKIRRLEATILYLKYQLATHETITAHQEFETIQSQVSSQELEASRLFRTETELTTQVTPLREELAIAGAVLKKTEIDALTIQGQLNEALDKIGRLERAKHNITLEKDRETQLVTDADTVLLRIKHELSETETLHDDEPEEIEYLASRVEVGKKELIDVENDFDNLKAKINELTLRNQSFNENLERCKNRKLRLEEQYITINKQQTEAHQIIDTDLSIHVASGEKQKIMLALGEAKRGLVGIDEKLTHTTHHERQAREEMMNAEAITNKLSAQIKGLAEIVERTQVKGTAKNLEKITVSIGFEKAFGAVFGDDLSFDDNVSQPCFWQTLQGNHSHITVLSQTEPLNKYVKVPEFLQCAINRVGVVDSDKGHDLQKHLPAGGMLVSKCGKLWRSDGFVALEKSGSAAAIMLEQRNKLAELRKEYADSETVTQDKKNYFNVIVEQKKTLQHQHQQLQNHVRDCEKHLATAEKKIYEAENNLKLKQASLANIIERQEMVEKELSDSDKALQSALSDLEKITGTDDLKTKSEELKGKVTDKRMALADMRALLETKKRAGQERLGRIKTLKKDLSEWTSRYDNAAKRMADAVKKLQNIDDDLNFAKKQPSHIEDKQKNSLENLSLAQQRHAHAEEKSLSLEGSLSVVSKNLRQLQTEISKNREIMVRQESHLGIAQTKEADILLQITEKVNATPDNLRHELEFDESQTYPEIFVLEEECKNFNRQRDASGAVNLLAEQELTEVESESLVMITEKNDLHQAIQKLNAAIKDINKEGREKILIAFEHVNENFQHLFKHLFSGGTAELKLVESDDPLEAGLEIMAQPPGKKTASLSLLSGGEQALTCMALIFAVFLTNPSPICVLDEVDAPLDDANVERYCNLINEMTNVTDTRFLVITHHSLTMARTDRLFGVTMAERGVSQLVSVDLKSAERLLEHAA